VRVHLDTDLGGDTDDACALVMLLGWAGVEITSITTVADPGGRRAAYVAHLLHLAGRNDIPLAAGAEVSSTTLDQLDPVIDDERHWPTSITPRPSPPGAALDLLERSLDAGATLIAIGPYTNLALLEITRAGSLNRQPPVSSARAAPQEAGAVVALRETESVFRSSLLRSPAGAYRRSQSCRHGRLGAAARARPAAVGTGHELQRAMGHTSR
jgi:hypothetical protein